MGAISTLAACCQVPITYRYLLTYAARNEDRAWYFDEGTKDAPRLISMAHPKAGRSLTTLEALGLAGAKSMGRSFESVRMGAKDVSARWTKAAPGPCGKEDQVYALRLAEMAKKHSSEVFYALDDPLEAAIFSVLIESMKEPKKRGADL